MTRFKFAIPSPLHIALALSLFVFLIAWLFTDSGQHSTLAYGGHLLLSWQDGLWSLLSFYHAKW